MAKFGKEIDQRKALMRGLAKDLFLHGSIETTTQRAKDLRPVAEKLITKARKGGVANRRLVMAKLGGDRHTTARLFDEIAPGIKRESGYLKISKSGNRKGDNAEMSVIEFVDDVAATEGGA